MVNKTPSRRATASMPTGPKSSEVDEIDEIYSAVDPIESSIEIRKKGGSL